MVNGRNLLIRWEKAIETDGIWNNFYTSSHWGYPNALSLSNFEIPETYWRALQEYSRSTPPWTVDASWNIYIHIYIHTYRSVYIYIYVYYTYNYIYIIIYAYTYYIYIYAYIYMFILHVHTCCNVNSTYKDTKGSQDTLVNLQRMTKSLLPSTPWQRSAEPP